MTSPRIGDLTVHEFKELVRESVIQSIAELLGDPGQGLDLRDDLTEDLQRSLAEVAGGGRTKNDEPFGCCRET